MNERTTTPELNISDAYFFSVWQQHKNTEISGRSEKIECDKQFQMSGVVSDTLCIVYTYAHTADTRFSEAPEYKK